MNNDQERFEGARPEDDWGLSLDEQRELAAKRSAHARPGQAEVATKSAPGAALDNGMGSEMAPPEQPSTATASAATPPIALPLRSKPDQYPAFMARGALFSASKHGAPLPQSAPLKAQGSYALRASGPRLSMRDKAAWEAAMQVAKECEDASQDIPISLADLARRMGAQEANGAAYASIRASLDRLAQTDVEVTLNGRVHAGKLLAMAQVKGRACFIRLDLPLSLAILEDDFQFKINSVRRRSLNSSLAQWLHDFVSTHSAYGGKLTVAYLRELCGFEGQAKRFPSLLSAALLELAAKAPELVAGHAFNKVGQSSDKWELNIQRGSEAPSFSRPKAQGTPASATTAPKSRKVGKWLAL